MMNGNVQSEIRRRAALLSFSRQDPLELQTVHNKITFLSKADHPQMRAFGQVP